MLNSTSTKKKKLNKLIPLTHILTDKKLMEINKNTAVSNDNAIFAPSKNF